MSDRTFSPGPTPNTVRSADGMVLPVPEGWVLLPPGDAALTRRVKAAGEGGIATATSRQARLVGADVEQGVQPRQLEHLEGPLADVDEHQVAPGVPQAVV